MDIELERRIELLEWQRDNAMRIRCPLVAKKYGKLPKDWQSLIRDGFKECMRVLKPNGTLIFKWNESEIKAAEVLSVIPFKPLFGHTTGRQSKTIWMCFMKQKEL